MRSDSSERGFTLVEVVVYVAILGIVISATGSFLLWALRGEASTRAIGNVSSNAYSASSRILAEIREAEAVYSPTSVFSEHPGQLSLLTKNGAPPGHERGYVDFFLCGETVCRKREGENPEALTSSSLEVEELVFSEIVHEGEIIGVRVSLTVSARPDFPQKGQRISSEMTSSATLRLREE